jgi:hydrogenase nickel incorporation protein HypA/HybF
MHEFGIAQTLVATVVEAAEKQDAERILTIRLRIGPLSGIVTEALTFAFDAVAAGTLAEGAELAIDETSVVCYCEACDKEFTATPGCYLCPDCGDARGTLRGGRELDVLDMEIA